MRKLLVFLVLLALGAGLVWWFDSRRAPESTPTAAKPEVEPLPSQESPKGELTELGQSAGKGAQVALSGPLDIWANDTSDPAQPRKRSHLVATDSRTLGEGDFELLGTTFELFDPASGEREATAKASRAKARILVEPAPALDETSPIVLEDADVRYERGSRFAPLTLRVPRLESVVALERASSSEVLVIEGRGLNISGRGLALERKAESITIENEPRARVLLDDGSAAMLQSSGQLVVRSREDLGPQTVELELQGEAQLQLEGGSALKLRADSIRLFGTLERAESSRMRPLRAEATGHVVVEPAEGLARAERLLMEFDENGRPRRATLDGSPELEALLRGENLADVPPELLREGDKLTVLLDGAGPLELGLGQARSFLFTGPARLRMPAVGATLLCDGAIRGDLGESKSDASAARELIAEGNVRFTYEQSTLTTQALRVASFYDASGASAVRLATESDTRLVGVLPSGESVDVFARGGLVAEQRQGLLFLPLAREVDFSLGGPRAMRGKARRVEDLDVERARLVAIGQVEVELPEGRGRGERFEARSAESGELSGTEEAPARVEVADGWFEARFIDLEPHQLDARGGAHAFLESPGLSHDLRAGWIVLQRGVTLEDVEEVPELILDAGETVRVVRIDEEEKLSLATERFHAEARGASEKNFEPTLMVALGETSFALDDGAPKYSGRGHRLELRADRTGRLEPNGSGAKVALSGRIGQRAETLEVLANRIDFGPERLVAAGFEVEFDGMASGLAGDSRGSSSNKLRAIGGLMSIDETQVTLSEGVYLGGADQEGQPWSIDADLLVLRGSRNEEDAEEGSPTISWVDLVAHGTVRLEGAGVGRAQADVMTIEQVSRRVALLGERGGADAREATIERSGTTWSSPSFTLDLSTGFLQSEAGSVRSSPDELESWSLSYDALEPIPMEDRTALVFRQPVFRDGANVLRANWALLWVDATRWRELASDGAREPTLVDDPDLLAGQRVPLRAFGGFSLRNASTWLQELYLDGDVEYRIGDQRKARAEAIYLDMVDGHGWVHEFVLDVELPLGGRDYSLKVQAAWLRTSSDGSMSANNALATTCQYDVPDYEIKIGSFSILPRFKTVERRNPNTGRLEEVSERDGWDFQLDDNEITVAGGMGIPLPRIAGPMTNDYKLDRDALSVGGFRLPSFGSDSKLGTFISASISGELGWIGDGFRWLAEKLSPDLDLPDQQGSNRARVDLTSRGIVLGLESEIRAGDKYRYNFNLDTVWDTGRDRGLVRVDPSERGDLRTWFHSRGRFMLGRDEWIDTVLTYQTDPGVQAEFWESSYLAYEERENFAYWRKVDGLNFYSATAEARVEDFRTSVIDQPSLGWLSGRAEVGRVADLPIVASSNVSIDNLARFNGDPTYQAPFADGLGNRQVTRLDTGHRVEVPLTFDFAGLRTTPFVEARATGWSESQSDDSSASRTALIAGVTTSTSVWRTFADGSRHVVTPSIEVRSDVVSSEHNLPVVEFDLLDRSVQGQFVDFNLRSRWESRELTSDLDMEVSQTWADNVGVGLTDGWLPTATRMNWLSSFRGIPYGVMHDGRYDTVSGETDYSRTITGIEPYESLTLETGYHTGRDRFGDRLYNALSVGARYALSAKWELEGRQTFSIGGQDDRLAYAVSLRRFGHDFVFEMQNSYVAGEGVGSLRFNITPNFAWRRDASTLLDRWRAARR